MKYLYLLLSLFFPLHFVAAQSISVGSISRLTLCTGDTVWVPYTSNGSFKPDNFFAAQLSDGNGSFSTFTNIGHFTATADSIPVVIWGAADHFRVRVIATDPYTISSNTSSDIRVFNYPSPNPANSLKDTYIGEIGFVGETIQFRDASTEPLGSKFLWSFDQDASITISSNPSPAVTYPSVGMKSGKLTVFNGVGCSTTSKPFQLRILSCNPVIPDSAHVVTGTESGSFQYVWVKAGGNYSANGEGATIFVEPGASLQSVFRSVGIYYIKNGASFFSNSFQGYAAVILNTGNSINKNGNAVDTFSCSNLQFDYSKVSGPNEVRIDEHPLQIQNSPNNLRVSSEGSAISVSVVNLLGFPIASKTEFETLNLDLTNFSNGVYFAIITSGDHRELRKISVVH